jgi:hypothetical protein
MTIKIKYNIKKLIGKCGLCPVFASYILAFALKMRKKHGKTSARVVSRATQVDSTIEEQVQYKDKVQYKNMNSTIHRRKTAIQSGTM